MNDADLAQRFAELSAVLCEGQRWWKPRAFVERELPWEAVHPDVSACLRALPLEQSERLASDDETLANFLAPWIPIANDLLALCKVPTATALRQSQTKVREPMDVPGRKWQQIQTFVGALEHTDLPAVEWCSGKAHLGRWYAQQNHVVVDALEWNSALVDAGNRLSVKSCQSVHVHHVDVLSSSAAEFLQANRHVLALHACGQLHVHLLQLCASSRPVRRLTLAPCCYHLVPFDTYQPMSRAANSVGFSLDKLDLHTAIQESVTSPERILKQRRQLQSWRLGFDQLQRDVRGVDTYIVTPSVPLTVLRGGFAAFCVDMAARKQIALPANVDFASYERHGVRRFVEVNALDLPRVLFRRALELWLVLDRALYLQQNGYRVTIATFCDRALTPRNLLIQAVR